MKNNLYTLLFALFITTLAAQDNQSIWSKISKREASVGKRVSRKAEPSKSVYYQLDINKLKDVLSPLLSRNTDKKVSNLIVQFPNSEGGFDAFSVRESSILEATYREKYPEIRTYIGQNIEMPSSIISFSITPQGLHAMMLSSKSGTQFIDPYVQNDMYMVYNKGDLPNLKKGFQCLVSDDVTMGKETNNKSQFKRNANDSRLRTYRLALASTIEYSEFHWRAAGLTASSSINAKKAAVLAAMVVTINRVNTIYQRDLAIKLVLIDNSDIIFIDSDNFTNNEARELINESQIEIDNAIPSADYDIGHTFSTGGGGLAAVGSVCVSTRKASGITGSPAPVGDAYDIDYVAHEFGHQFGAPHTFNGNTGNCAGTTRTASNAYEPGSGTTIMAYAGICSPQNVQSNSDAYFHQKSIQMIWDNITSGFSTCGAELPVSNRPPVANAGSDYTIPISTAFKLVGSSTDPDGITGHTYTWEQYDLGLSGLPLETNTTGPLVRSFEGSSNPVRNIPNFQDYVLAAGSTTWEKLPSVNRTMTFALTVRDNDVSGLNGAGQTDVDFVNINTNSIDPFALINPVSWVQGSTQTIEWVVGQTTNAAINCQNVSIKLSTDGGITFPIVVTSNTTNDGAFSYVVPALPDTANARLLIEATDHIFYDVSDFNFSISPDSDFFIVEENLTPLECNETTAVYNFDYVPTNGFSENTTFSALGTPAGANAVFSPTSKNTRGNVTMTISNLEDVAFGNYNITIRGISATKTKDKNVVLPFFSGFCTSTGNTDFQTSTTLVQFNTINQTSGKTSGYTNYLVSTNINRNNTYDLTVKVNTDGSFTTRTKVWIDWNQDCRFDIDEEYDLGDAFNTSDGETNRSPLAITTPNSAFLGETTMRVSTKYNIEPDSCENGFDGEVEDYIINVMPSLSADQFDFENLSVFPNPNKGEFTVKLNNSGSEHIFLDVYDLRGRHIYKNKYDNTGRFNEKINLNTIQSGMYILTVSDGTHFSSKKIMVE